MKKFIKENWFKILIVALILLFILGWFYWFQWRTTDIKKECAKWSLEKAKTSDTSYDQEYYDDYYLRCLRENGIK